MEKLANLIEQSLKDRYPHEKIIVVVKTIPGNYDFITIYVQVGKMRSYVAVMSDELSKFPNETFNAIIDQTVENIEYDRMEEDYG